MWDEIGLGGLRGEHLVRPADESGARPSRRDQERVKRENEQASDKGLCVSVCVLTLEGDLNQEQCRDAWSLASAIDSQ